MGNKSKVLLLWNLDNIEPSSYNAQCYNQHWTWPPAISLDKAAVIEIAIWIENIAASPNLKLKHQNAISM